MKIYVKYMVSLRCKMIVKEELEKQGLTVSSVELGVVETPNEVSEQQLVALKDSLFKSDEGIEESVMWSVRTQTMVRHRPR